MGPLIAVLCSIATLMITGSQLAAILVFVLPFIVPKMVNPD